MVYMFKLPSELMGKMVEIRTKTKISMAQQVREAVRDYCDEGYLKHEKEE